MTPRQQQALDYRKSGLLLKEIGERMGIGVERARQLVMQARWIELGKPECGPWGLSSRLTQEDRKDLPTARQ
jgi:Sigma-70, region 4